MSKCQAFTLLLSVFLVGCSHQTGKPMQAVDNLELNRFMGDWHVLADIATPFDRNAVMPLERYRLNDDKVVETIYQYREGTVEGPVRERHIKGFVSKQSNAIWGMQVFWPIKADYRVVYLDEGYQTTIIGRVKRDFVWIMARTPTIDNEHFDALLERITFLGYDTDDLRIHEPMRSQYLSAETASRRTPQTNP
jgi:apolipoprotein D and lipocalin family protein